MPNYAFICSANMCRSPMAQAIFEHLAAERGLRASAFSAGTMGVAGYLPVPEAQAACQRHGVRMPQIRSQSVHSVVPDMAACERIFVMEEAHRDFLVQNQLAPPEHIELLGRYGPDTMPGEDIPDPIGQDDAAFEACFRLLEECIRGYLDQAGL